jgi:mono/diheme cytochrome c family protein
LNYTLHAPARLLLALGFVASAWPTLSAPTQKAEPPSQTGAAPAAMDTEHFLLVQADAVPVTYASEQADRGEGRYEKECGECHGADLKGGLIGGPPLRGVSFEQKFADGAPASGLYLYMSTLMPPNSPGRFSPSAYADMMAYILKRNGFAAGAPLPSDVDALDALIMEK